MITVLFTMKHDKCKVFFPAIVTMIGLHLMSVGFGTILKSILPLSVIVIFSILLFIFFGLLMLYEAYSLKSRSSEEKIAELEKGLLEQKDPEAGTAASSNVLPKLCTDANAEASNVDRSSGEEKSPSIMQQHYLMGDISRAASTNPATPMKMALETTLPIEQKKTESKFFCANPYLQLVMLLFLADWGDRCQISAVTLTTMYNVWGVALGGSIVIS